MRTELLIAILLSLIALVYYRWFIYQFYIHYPRDKHFYLVQTYTRTSSYAGLLFWWWIYALLLIMVCVRGKTFSYTLDAYIVFLNAFALISSLDFKLHLIPIRLLVLLAVNTLLIRSSADLVLVEQVQMLIVLGLLYIVSRRGIGVADIYLLLIFSFLFPMEHWLWLIWIAASLGLLYALMLRLFRKSGSHTIAFGPWLCLSAWLILLLA